MGTSSSVTAVLPLNATHGRKPTILLVEDESVVREITRQVLEHAGYEVLESEGPREALCLAAEHRGRIGLLLSDIVMPGMNGLDLAHRIQAIQPRVTTVFMSGYAENAMLQKGLSDSRSTYIQKPFTIDMLLACVDKALASPASKDQAAALTT